MNTTIGSGGGCITDMPSPVGEHRHPNAAELADWLKERRRPKGGVATGVIRKLENPVTGIFSLGDNRQMIGADRWNTLKM